MTSSSACWLETSGKGKTQMGKIPACSAHSCTCQLEIKKKAYYFIGNYISFQFLHFVQSTDINVLGPNYGMASAMIFGTGY